MVLWVGCYGFDLIRAGLRFCVLGWSGLADCWGASDSGGVGIVLDFGWVGGLLLGLVVFKLV